jgi:hypothetical protein
MRHPKNQLKSSQKGEGPKNTMSASDPSAGAVDSNLSMDTQKIEGAHTTNWATGSTLTVKRNG